MASSQMHREDVVAGCGLRLLLNLKSTAKPFKELVLVQKKLEKHFKDMQNEVTIEEESCICCKPVMGKGLD